MTHAYLPVSLTMFGILVVMLLTNCPLARVSSLILKMLLNGALLPKSIMLFLSFMLHLNVYPIKALK